MFGAIGSYDDIWKAIILPNRQEYSVYDLGPTELHIQGNRIKRTDFRLLNKRGFSIQCSYFQQANIDKPIPCVIYLHANGCCRLEALQYLDTVLSNPVSFFCFDFSGCGKSDGLYTSVGWYEQDDLECVTQYLYNTGKVSKIAVWGRSMGSITALLYANKDPRINCLIFDSPFANFKQFVKELVKSRAPIPEFLVSGALKIIRNTILSKADFDIDALRPIKYIDKIKVPALFGAAKDDTFVSPQHTKDLYAAYGGHKELLIFEGDHNSQRPANWTKLVQNFLKVHLLGEKIELQATSKPYKSIFTEKSARNEEFTISEETIQSSHHLKKAASLNNPPSAFSHMTFSWLENTTSSPALSAGQQVQQSSDKSLQSEKPENNQNSKTKPLGKKLQSFFSPTSTISQGYNLVPSEQTHTGRTKSTINYSGYEDKTPKAHASTPMSQTHARTPDMISGIRTRTIFNTEASKPTHSRMGFEKPMSPSAVPKVSISLKGNSNNNGDTSRNESQRSRSKPKIFSLVTDPSTSSRDNSMVDYQAVISNPTFSQRLEQQNSPKIGVSKGGNMQANSALTVRSPNLVFSPIKGEHHRFPNKDSSTCREPGRKGASVQQANVNLKGPFISSGTSAAYSNQMSYISSMGSTNMGSASQLGSKRNSENVLTDLNGALWEEAKRRNFNPYGAVYRK